MALNRVFHGGGKMNKTLSELMPTFGKFHCNVTVGIDGSAVYKGEVYPVAIDEERGKVKILINDGEIALFTTLDEITKYGVIE